MGYKLVCTMPCHGVNKGDKIIDPAEIAKHVAKRGHHFVRAPLTEAEQEEVNSILAALAETPVQN